MTGQPFRIQPDSYEPGNIIVNPCFLWPHFEQKAKRAAILLTILTLHGDLLANVPNDQASQ
jgi:hypothetical protein